MPISLSINQPSGEAATYHVVNTVEYASFGATPVVNISVNSYINQAAFAAGDTPLSQNPFNVAPMLAAPSVTPPAGATVQQAIVGMIEQYLLTTPAFTGGTQVS